MNNQKNIYILFKERVRIIFCLNVISVIRAIKINQIVKIILAS